MKRLLLFLALAIITNLNGQSCSFENPGESLGIGILTFDAVDGLYVELYNDSALKKRFVFWDVYNKKPIKPVCTLFYKPDYGELHFVCLRKLKRCYEVLINGNQKKYVSFLYRVRYYSWDEYLKGLNSVSFIADTTTKYIYYEPDIKSGCTEVTELNEQSYCVVEVKGDRIKVRLDCDSGPTPCNQMECKSPAIGWIRWRKGNQLPVQFSYLC